LLDKGFEQGPAPAPRSGIGGVYPERSRRNVAVGASAAQRTSIIPSEASIIPSETSIIPSEASVIPSEAEGPRIFFDANQLATAADPALAFAQSGERG